MKWWQHALTGIPCVIVVFVLVALFDNPRFGKLDLVALVSFSLPDMDTRKVDKNGATKHRHWFWHSAIIPLGVFMLGFWEGSFNGAAAFCVMYGVHLLADLKPPNGTKTGTYLIYIKKGDRMSVRRTDAYLLLNGVVCILLAFISMLL